MPAPCRFIVSDTHFGHTNILEYDGRPFSSIEAHDEALIKNWNALVQPHDTVYHLGDIALFKRAQQSPKTRLATLLRRLQGKIHLVRGNHDHDVDAPGVRERFETIENLTILKLRGEAVATPGGTLYVSLCHYPMLRWKNSHRPDAWHLFGHEHGCLRDPRSLSFDCGIMLTGWAPMPWEGIVATMKRKIKEGYGPTEHHGDG